jgi:RNA polymerase sigma-70 factor (ECF subfamily)
MFSVPFDDLAGILGRSPAAARQLASGARRRVHGTAPAPDTDVSRQREIVNALLAASRNGDFDALLAVFDPDVVLRADAGSLHPGDSKVVRGAARVAEQALLFSSLAQHCRPTL